MTPTPNREDVPPGTDGRKLATGGAAILIVLAMMVVRGAKHAAVDALDGQPAQRPEAELRAELERKRAAAFKAQLAETDWSGREIALRTAQATQRQLALPEADLDTVLQDIWKSKRPDAKVFPWQVNIVDWRLTFDWDVNEVRRLLEQRAAELAKTAKGTEN